LAAASEEKSSVVEAGNTCLDQRKLVTSFLFGPRVIGWRCSLCRKLFCVTIHDGTPDDCPPDYVRWDFERHSCLLNLHTEFEHKQLRS
jgi:hypothetical protein